MHAESIGRATFESPIATGFSPLSEPVSQDRLDENLHFGRAWHRYHYCYRQSGREELRILDAGCGTGRASVEAARLNPRATVLGVDASAAALDFARERAEAAGLFANVSFFEHDPSRPWPESLGRFDFIVCRGSLARAELPERMMASLARALDPAGLMYITLPSRSGQETARALRQAVDALVPVASHVQNSAERFQVGVELVQALHHDHPIRHRIMDGRVEGDAERFVADCLADSRDWTYHEAVALMTEAGLRPLYLATPWRWRSDRVFASNDLTEGLQVRLDNLDADSTGLLIDALDASILDGEYRFYACHSSHEPLIPTWVSENREPAKRFDHLVPHRSELMTPLTAGLGPTNGRMLYRSVSGTLSELDRWSSLLLEAADGSTSCGEIEKSLSRRARASDDPTARHQRWIDLAEGGLIFLEDPRT